MRIFISYSSANRRIVEELKDDLEKAGYEVWYDQRLKGGQEWWDEILHKIRECNAFLFTVTTSSLSSDPCEKEYKYAISLNKAFIPVLLTDVSESNLPLAIRKFNWVKYNIADNRSQLLDLIKALNQYTTSQPRSFPDPLPSTPEIPFSSIDKLADQIVAKPNNYEGQIAILDEIKRYLNHAEYSQDSWQLLKQLYNQDMLFAKVKDEIRELLPLEPQTSHLNKYVKLEPRTFVGHAGTINAIDFSPDNSMLLTGSSDFKAMLWDTVTGRQIHVYKGHTDEITCVDFSSDGQFVITGSKDSSARLWSVSMAESVNCFDGHKSIISSVKISPDRKWVFSGSKDKTARLYDIKDGSFVREFTHSKEVTAIAFSFDGEFVFTATRYDNDIIQWNRETGEQVQTYLGHKDTINAIVCSQNGKYLLTGSDDGSARLWEMSTGQFKDAFAGHTYPVFDVKFSPNQNHIVTVGIRIYAEYRVWDLLSGKLIVNNYESAKTFDSLALSSDGEYLAVGIFREQSVSILKSASRT